MQSAGGLRSAIAEVLTMGERAPVKLADPVCGMELDDSSADANLAWHDQRLLFCSEQCLRRFLDRPQAYADD
jgi:YHS domain-containing protein